MADEAPKITQAPPVTVPTTTVTAPVTTATVGTATSGPVAPPQPDMWGSLMWTLLPMIIIFYFLLIRPENKRKTEQTNMLSKMKKGDKVLLTIGIYGSIADIDGEDVSVIIDPKKDVRIKVRKEAIGTIVDSKE